MAKVNRVFPSWKKSKKGEKPPGEKQQRKQAREMKGFPVKG